MIRVRTKAPHEADQQHIHRIEGNPHAGIDTIAAIPDGDEASANAVAGSTPEAHDNSRHERPGDNLLPDAVVPAEDIAVGTDLQDTVDDITVPPVVDSHVVSLQFLPDGMNQNRIPAVTEHRVHTHAPHLRHILAAT